MGFTVDIDTGGTFTDGFVARGDDYRLVKVPTTPHDLTQCFVNCIAKAAEEFELPIDELLFDADIVRFSNTIGTNTIIQRDGAKIGLILTRDGAGLALDALREDFLVARDMIAEIEERTGAAGDIEVQPTQAEAMEAAQTLIDRGARAIVVAFENSDANADNEKAVRRWIKAEYPRDYLGSVPVFIASDVSPRAGARERINSAVINAYIHPKLSRLLYKADEELRKAQYRGALLICHNNGAAARVAKTRAINTYNSGPSAGLLGACEIGKLYGCDDLVTTDMGGTSFDIGFVKNGRTSYSLRPDVEGFACNVPMSSVLALGAGGGSIARVEDGALRVGPQSAGALPGPVAFDLGGAAPTVTDANLVLGYLDPDFFLGGEMPLNAEKARASILAEIGDKLGVGAEEAAWRIRTEIDRYMGSSIKKIIEDNGLKGDLIIAYGGAGGLHCCSVAEIAGVSRTIITPFSSVSSAFSSSLMDVGHIYYRRVERPLADAPGDAAVKRAVAEMRAEADRDMRGEGFPPDTLAYELQFLIAAGDVEVMATATEAALSSQEEFERVMGQARELVVAAGGDADQELQVATLGLSVSAKIPHFVISEGPEGAADASSAKKAERRMYCGESGRFETAPVYDQTLLQRGMSLAGPAIVESPKTSIVVTRGWRLTVDARNNSVLERV